MGVLRGTSGEEEVFQKKREKGSHPAATHLKSIHSNRRAKGLYKPGVWLLIPWAAALGFRAEPNCERSRRNLQRARQRFPRRRRGHAGTVNPSPGSHLSNERLSAISVLLEALLQYYVWLGGEGRSANIVFPIPPPPQFYRLLAINPDSLFGAKRKCHLNLFPILGTCRRGEERERKGWRRKLLFARSSFKLCGQSGSVNN